MLGNIGDFVYICDGGGKFCCCVCDINGFGWQR